MKAEHRDLDVIIPFHGRSDLLLGCLRAMAGNSAIAGSVFLVDDGSLQPPSETVQAAIRDLNLPVRWVRFDRRRGFVEAVNGTWPQCRSPVVLILNNDVFIEADTIAQICAAIDRDPGLGAVAPASNNGTDLFQYRADRVVGPDRDAVPRVISTLYLTGMCLAVRAKAVTTPWLFDPIYSPGYFEDMDLSCRIWSTGWRLGVVESSRVDHLGGATFRQDPHRRAYIQRNFAIFAERWGHLPQHGDLEQCMRSVYWQRRLK
jgi:GT2 family glycosyltransferase